MHVSSWLAGTKANVSLTVDVETFGRSIVIGTEGICCYEIHHKVSYQVVWRFGLTLPAIDLTVIGTNAATN